MLPDYGRGPDFFDTNQPRPDIILTMAAPLGENGEPVGEALFGDGAAPGARRVAARQILKQVIIAAVLSA